MRSRKALQYANHNNGGYANDWLIGDRKTGGIAYLELGLKNTLLWRTKDGYFVSSTFARDPKLIQEEASGFTPSAAKMSFVARTGHPCGGFCGEGFSGAASGVSWQKPPKTESVA
jgi:hypothetical protein